MFLFVFSSNVRSHWLSTVAIKLYVNHHNNDIGNTNDWYINKLAMAKTKEVEGHY